MKKLFFIAMVLLISSLATAQTAQDSIVIFTKGESSTQSALCDAQDLISNYLITEGFHGDTTINIGKEYDKLIMPTLIQCVRNDTYNWGYEMEKNAEFAKFKSIKITFEKSKNEYKIPKKAIRLYKKALNWIKQNFFDKRKKFLRHQIFTDPDLIDMLEPVAETLKQQFLEGIKKASK